METGGKEWEMGNTRLVRKSVQETVDRKLFTANV